MIRKLVDRVFLILLASATSVFGHDFWIEPSTFRPAVGVELKVGLKVGEHFAGEPQKRAAEKIKEFMLVGANGPAPISGVEGADPAGTIKIDRPGVYVIGYRSNRSSIELDAEKFTAYLEEEGLEQVLAVREQLGQTGHGAKEVYSRCAKAIIAVGSGGGGHDRALDYPLELIPQENPYALKSGDELTLRLVFNGKPLEGAKVVALNKDDPKKPQSATSDDAGAATFKLAKPGVWMIKAVHMIPAPKEAGADWESFWSSLTFEVR